MRDARAVVHDGIANLRFTFKSVAVRTYSAFPVHAQPAILRIWWEAHRISNPSDVMMKDMSQDIDLKTKQNSTEQKLSTDSWKRLFIQAAWYI